MNYMVNFFCLRSVIHQRRWDVQCLSQGSLARIDRVGLRLAPVAKTNMDASTEQTRTTLEHRCVSSLSLRSGLAGKAGFPRSEQCY